METGSRTFLVAPWPQTSHVRVTNHLDSVFFGVFISTIESSITATILVTVSEHFGDFDLAPWVVLAYLLTYMGQSPCHGCSGPLTQTLQVLQ